MIKTVLQASAIGLALSTALVLASEPPGVSNVDHARIISRWDKSSLERGRQLFLLACAPCHGTNGVQTVNPQARPFATAKFQNGSDPYSLFRTITQGYKNMPSQTWMTPEQRYEVIQYIRETFLRKLNPSQYVQVNPAYLASLPKFDAALAEAANDSKTAERDFGPALESQLGTNVADALTLRLQHNVTLSYDLHHMRLAGAWRGGFLDLSRTGHYQQRGEGQPLPAGKPLRGLQHWCWAFDGRFDYPTAGLLPRGPLPSNWMHYHGHYVYNRQAVLSFSVDGRDALELPEAEITNETVLIFHTLRIGPGPRALRLCVGQPDSVGGAIQGLVAFGEAAPKARKGAVAGNLVMASESGSASTGLQDCGDFVTAGVAGQTDGLEWEADDHQRLVLAIPPGNQPRVIQVVCSAGHNATDLQQLGHYLSGIQSAPVPDPGSLTHGGARLWPLPLEVRGQLGKQPGAYALDTIPVPFENPYGAWLRTSALAFFSDGRAAVTTYGGDVWIVSGLEAKLENVRWSRFAAGLYEPFGAQVIDGTIYVTCRNGIVRLHDLNGDGEADFYETFYADADVSEFFHSFNFDLQVDPRGHLYYTKPGEYTDYKLPGAVIEVLPDGSQGQVYCTGFRVPNGMGMLPDGRLTVSDNQGNWMPASKINLVRKGGFYGYVQNLKGGGAFGDQWAPDAGHIDTRKVTAPPTFDQPIIWMPQEFDNSSSAQVWAGDARFGPLSGRLLHTSFGKGWMYYLTLQEIGSTAQAAIVALPFQFDAGLMRARVNPADGQVYATGLSGWQGPPGGKDGCLQRLRYTGKPMKLLDDVQVRHDGLLLRFNFPLDPAAAINPSAYHLEQWNYLWSANYGSDQYSALHPGQKGHDPLPVSEVRLRDGGREALLVIPELRPVNQVELKLGVKAADGTLFQQLAYLTINVVPEK